MLDQYDLSQLEALGRVEPGQKNHDLARALRGASIKRALTHTEWQKVYAINATWDRHHGAQSSR